MISVLEEALGFSVVGLTVLLVFAALRRLLRHSVGLWARRRLEPNGAFEYRFTIQNLEPVPIDVELAMTLVEDNFPQGAQLPSLQNAPGRLSIYSGKTDPQPVSNPATVRSNPGQVISAFAFNEMPAYDTWTIKVASPAKRAKLTMTPGGVPLGPLNPLRPWVAVTLSASSVTVDSDEPVSSSPRSEPTWTTGLVVACLGPAIYVAAFIVLQRTFWQGAENEDGHWLFLDWTVLALLAFFGFLWYRSVRRPVYPTIQSYTKPVTMAHPELDSIVPADQHDPDAVRVASGLADASEKVS